nr:MAG TPA: hypothetical protein [Caudoviricetes sp.]
MKLSAQLYKNKRQVIAGYLCQQKSTILIVLFCLVSQLEQITIIDFNFNLKPLIIYQYFF